MGERAGRRSLLFERCHGKRTVSLRACTKTITCLPLRSAASAFSYAISVISVFSCCTLFTPFVPLAPLAPLTPMKVCVSGTGRYAAPKWKRPVSGLTRRKRATSA